MITNSKKSSQVAVKNNQPSKWEVYNRITGEVVCSNIDKSDADQKLAGIYVDYWKGCFCTRQEQLLERSFPLDVRRVGHGWSVASGKMKKDWEEFEHLDKEFCDAWNNAPSEEEGKRLTDLLRFDLDLHYLDTEEFRRRYGKGYGR